MKKIFTVLFFATGFAAMQAHAGVIGKTIKYKAGKTNLYGYIAYDDAKQGKRPAVIVVPDWWNNSKFARDRADTLAKMGYTAMVMDVYGDGIYKESPKEAGKLMNNLTSKPKVMRSRFKAALSALKKHKTVDRKKIAAIGYSLGGMYVIQMAREGIKLNGVVSFWGVINKPKKPALKGKVKARVLVLAPAEDGWAPEEAVNALKEEMTSAGAEYKLIKYPNTKHGFSRPDSTTRAEKYKLSISYDENADKKSWQDMDKFLKSAFN